jgi:hypothetical protein
MGDKSQKQKNRNAKQKQQGKDDKKRDKGAQLAAKQALPTKK